MQLKIGGMNLFGLLLSSCIFTVLIHVRCAFSADATLATSRQRNSQGNGKRLAMRLLTTTTTPAPTTTDFPDSAYDDAVDDAAVDDAEDDEDDTDLEDDLPSDDGVELSSSTPATEDSRASTRVVPPFGPQSATNTSSILVNVTSFVPVGSAVATTMPSPAITSDLSAFDIETSSESSVTSQSVITDSQEKQASGLVPLNLRGSNDNIEGSGDMPRGGSGKVDPMNPDDEDDADVDEDVLSPFEGSGMMPTRPSSPLKPNALKPSYPIPGGDRSALSPSDPDDFDIGETPDPNAPKIVTTTEMPQPTGNSLDNDRDLTADEDVAREIQDNFGNDPIVQKPANAPANLLAQPAMLAAVIGGAVVGLLCAILLVMYLLYRMRKKDEGSYALDEPQKRPGGYMRAPTNSSKEYYA